MKLKKFIVGGQNLISKKYICDRLVCIMQFKDINIVNDMIDSLHLELFDSEQEHIPPNEYKDEYCPKCSWYKHCRKE